MNCRRSHELLSDHIEAALPPPLARELEKHLVSCGECTELLSALGEVVSALASFRVPDAPKHLSELVVERTRPVLRAARGAREGEASGLAGDSSSWWNTSAYFAAAAVLAGVLLWHPPEFLAGASRRLSQTTRQAYSFGVRTYHQTERWFQELNVLRMTVGVAFENRIDRLNERLRELEEATRPSGDDGNDSSRSQLPSQSEVVSSDSLETRSLL